MTALPIMVQGTGSYVGKSVLSAALCRYFYRQGYRVAPFKAQNMSNNSFVTLGGGEIGRAQAFQATACGIEPTVEMNPILLKPASDMGSQVVVLGKPIGHMRARKYHQYQSQLIKTVRESFERLASVYDVVVIEGAGSPAEVNLRNFDIANMAVAKMTNAPVVLVGDIHVGGVFAWLVGTLELLEPEERALIKAFVINKFRGDPSLLTDGIAFLERRTGKKTLGVVPFVPNLRVDEEDGVKATNPRFSPSGSSEGIHVQVIELPRISNSTDFESFAEEPDVHLEFIRVVPHADRKLPDAVILPGTKSTVDDLGFLRSSGFEAYLKSLRSKGVTIVGVCGGYQTLGKLIVDVHQVEAETSIIEGLGFLDVETKFQPTKKTVRVRGISLAFGVEVSGYEIHMGQSDRSERLQPLVRVTVEQGQSVERHDGCISEDGLVWGTYIHGIFDSPGFRRAFLNHLRSRRGWPALPPQPRRSTEVSLDSLADLITDHLDCEMLDRILNGKI